MAVTEYVKRAGTDTRQAASGALSSRRRDSCDSGSEPAGTTAPTRSSVCCSMKCNSGLGLP